MKRIYLTLAVCFLAGHVMAQKSTVSSNSNSTVTHSSAVSTSTANPDLPGFPVYKNTGNKELDDANYHTAKENWIKENPDMYVIMNNGHSLKSSVVLTGFPVYVITGDSQADYDNYKKSRTAWMAQNETLYTEYLKSIR